MAELNDKLYITKLLRLMTGRGHNTNPVKQTGYQCVLPFFLFHMSGFPSRAEGCF